MIEFTCPACDATYKVPDSLAGRRARCKACRVPFGVPDPDRSAEDTAEMPVDLPKAFGEVIGEGTRKFNDPLAAALAKLPPLRAPRPVNLIGLLAGAALVLCVGLPWFQTAAAAGNMLRWPENGFAPFHLISGTTGLEVFGVEPRASVPILARFAFLLIPIAGILVVLRELRTARAGTSPRLTYLLGLLMPVLAVVLTNVGFSGAELPVAEVSLGAVMADEGAMSVLMGRLSLGALLCGVGMTLCLVAGLTIKEGMVIGRPALGGELSGTGARRAGVSAAVAATSVPGDGETRMYRGSSGRLAGQTSILQASALQAADAAVAAISGRSSGREPGVQLPGADAMSGMAATRPDSSSEGPRVGDRDDLADIPDLADESDEAPLQVADTPPLDFGAESSDEPVLADVAASVDADAIPAAAVPPITVLDEGQDSGDFVEIEETVGEPDLPPATPSEDAIDLLQVDEVTGQVIGAETEPSALPEAEPLDPESLALEVADLPDLPDDTGSADAMDEMETAPRRRRRRTRSLPPAQPPSMSDDEVMMAVSEVELEPFQPKPDASPADLPPPAPPAADAPTAPADASPYQGLVSERLDDVAPTSSPGGPAHREPTVMMDSGDETDAPAPAPAPAPRSRRRRPGEPPRDAH